MNNKVQYLISNFIAFILIMCVAACEGPVGPQGVQGSPGPQGEQGAEGPQGEEGTANVIYSDWIDIDWNREDSNTYKSMYIEEPRVTENDFMAGGMVMVYLKEGDGDNSAVYALPYTNGSNHLYYLMVDVSEQNLEGILFINTSTNGSNVQNLNGIQIRYVLIPGGVPAKMDASFLNNYEAVMEYYQLED